MKRREISAALMLVLGFTVLSRSSFAAEPPTIALVNLDRIYKTYKPLLARLEPLKAEAKELEQNVQVRQAELETVGAQLRRAQPGSPDFQRLQMQALKLQNELQQYVNTERQNMQKKEAALYIQFYREVDAQISKYSKAHRIKLVLRQQDASLEDDQPPQEILKVLNRTVLYEEGLDITDEIMKALDAAAAGGKAPAGER